MDLKKEMVLIKVCSDLQGEIRRLQAIRYCLTRPDNDMDITLDGLDMAIKNIKKDVEMLGIRG